MDEGISSYFDPFRVVVSFAAKIDHSDLFMDVFGFGLKFDPHLNHPEIFSHGTRIREYEIRVINAYESLSCEAKLAAANAALGNLLSLIKQKKQIPAFEGLSERLIESLRKIGWGLQDGQLVTLTPEIREMFFPKNSQWDAFVVIRAEIDKTQNELTLIDPYCDSRIFSLLDSSKARPKTVRLLCREKPAALNAEAKTFMSQHSNMNIELRTSHDFHDRFFIIDRQSCIHLGASINHAGSRAFMISIVQDTPNREALIKSADAAWAKGHPI